jgi:hypothetical protein
MKIFLLTSFRRRPDYVFAQLPTMGLFLLDYGAGNVQSLANTLEKLGHSFKWITSPADFDDATVSLQMPFYHPNMSHLSSVSSSLVWDLSNLLSMA